MFPIRPTSIKENQTEGRLFSFFYSVAENIFIDEEGHVCLNMLDYVTPLELWMFRHYCEYMLFDHRTIKGAVVELLYPDSDYFRWYKAEDEYYEQI